MMDKSAYPKGQGEIYPSERVHSHRKGEQPLFEVRGQSPRQDIKNNPPQSVVLTVGEVESTAVERYSELTEAKDSVDIHATFLDRSSIGGIEDFRQIKQRSSVSSISKDITEHLKKSKWEKDLKQALSDFEFVMDSADVGSELIRERATNLAIEFESAPEETIPFSVLQAIPEFAKYLEPELQNQLKEKLKTLREPASYEDVTDDEETLTWADLEQERRQYLDQLEPYLNRLKDRDTSVEDRKRHLLMVFYAHTVDNLTLDD